MVQPAGVAAALLGARPRPALRSVWPALYACAGVAAWLVWRRGGLGLGPLAAYAGMLAASWLAWPPLFGGGHPLPRACLDAAGARPSAWHFAWKLEHTLMCSTDPLKASSWAPLSRVGRLRPSACQDAAGAPYPPGTLACTRAEAGLQPNGLVWQPCL